jgi:hypothetical protein
MNLKFFFNPLCSFLPYIFRFEPNVVFRNLIDENAILKSPKINCQLYSLFKFWFKPYQAKVFSEQIVVYINFNC